MAENKGIENKIKEGFEAQSRKAPKGVWENIAPTVGISAVDVKINAKVNEGFETMNSTAPDEVWEAVKRQVNIDQAWWGVRRMLKGRILLRRIRDIAAALLLLLLLSWGGYQVLQNEKGSPVAEQTNVENVQADAEPVKGTTSIQKEIKESTKPQGDDISAALTESGGTVSGTDVKRFAEQDVKFAKTIQGDKPFVSEQQDGGINEVALTGLAEISTTAFYILDGDTALEYMPLLAYLIETDARLPDGQENSGFLMMAHSDDRRDTIATKPHRFEIGLTYSYNNTWLLNNETRTSYDPNSLTSTDATYASSYGLTASYGLSATSALVTEVYGNARVRQDYGIYVEGTYTDKDVELNYSKVTLLYQRNMLHRYGRVASRYTIKVGAYGAKLKTKYRYYNTVLVSQSDDYSGIDYGLKVAIGQEKELKRFVVGYGLNGEYGLKNIFTGNVRIPADFNKTTNAQIGAYLVLKYNL